MLTVAGREVRVTHPGKPYFTREAKLSQAGRRPLLPLGGRRRAGRHPRPPHRPQALRRRRRGRGLLPEARARQAPRLAAHRDAVVPVGTHGRGGRGRRRRRPRLDRQPRLHRAAPARGARRRSRPPRRAARRSRPRAGRRLGRRAARGAGGEGAARRAGLAGWPKTSGSRGMHVNARIVPRWTFDEVRRAALALSREIERRAPTIATSKWWKEERHGVFLDYNQNAKDRTTCSAYSMRAAARRARLGAARLGRGRRLRPGRLHRRHDAGAVRRASATRTPAWTPRAGSARELLELAARDEAAGLGDAPWPPHFRKTEGEAPRVAPSRARGAAKRTAAPGTRARRCRSSPSRTRPTRTPRWRGSSAGRHGTPKRRSSWRWTTCSSIRCAAARRPGPASAINLRHVPEATRPPQETPDPDDDPTREWRRLSREARRPATAKGDGE